ERMNLRARTQLLPGDAFTVDLGGPYDVIIVANVLLQFSATRCVELLHRLLPATRPGGRIVLAGFTTGDAPPRREEHARMLGLLMLASTGGGELHSTAGYRAMLESAGIANVRVEHRED